MRRAPAPPRVSLTLLKRIFVGRPISSHEEIHHRLSKPIALAVFASDALSSSAYATDEILLVLAAAGSGALGISVPIALAVAIVLSIVIASYRQTVRAYPQGGGAYRVARENLGEYPGLIAASALLIDYVLTVSVSVAAGMAAVGAAFPGARDHRVALALSVVGLITIANLRGLKESGQIFAIPTYGFMISMGIMIVAGAFQVLSGNYTALPHPDLRAEQALSLFLILRAFSSGSTALTGIEAISDGVPAFRRPESRNAAATLLVLGVFLSFLFLGITFLARAYQVDPHLIEQGQTVPSQIAQAVFQGGPAFYVVQVFTALILFLAANTSYADFPRLSSILATDRYLPSVLKARGDKLAFSNGIVLLALAAGAVLVHYEADVHRIIPLYVVGVFTSFTLSQTGMVLRWRRLQTPRWRRSALVNGVGALTTFVVLIVVSTTKFSLGAWQVIVLIPIVAMLLYRVRRHYLRVADELRMERRVTRIRSNRAVVLVSPYPGATLKALGFARAFAPEELHLLAFRISEARLRETRRRWKELKLKIPIEATGHGFRDLREYIEGLEPSEARPVTVVIPDPQDRRPLRQLRKNRLLLQVKRMLMYQRGVVVASVPFLPGVEPEPERLQAPVRLALIVVVSAVHRATIGALEYARSLNPSELKAVTIATNPEDGARLANEWTRWGVDFPLEVVDSPYRSLIQPLLAEVRELSPSPKDAVGVVVPEFVVGRWWQQFLHNQTALLIKTALNFEPNVVVIDVPYPLSADKTRTPPANGKLTAAQPDDR